jgi:hypothetical protein
MANQPKKYKKFVATAATATLVASAIVPVASASFSDVADTNSHKAAIDALVEAKVINGYADGTFKPNATLTRGHVVKMLGKWAETQGFSVPADYATVARFNDVNLNGADQELVKYAALLSDNNIFLGSNGALNAGSNITRENMALVLDRAVEAITGVSLVDVAASVPDVTVADLSSAKAEARPAIQALRDLGISNVANFDPKLSVSRGQFASFLYRTAQLNTAATPAIASVTAINKTTVEVKFNVAIDAAAATNFAIEGGAVNGATLSADGKTVTLAVTGLDYDKSYTLTTSNIKVKDEVVAFAATTFKTPAVTALWTLKVSPKEAQLVADGADNTVIEFQLLGENGQVDTGADNIVLEIGTTFGNLANTRVTIQDGVGQVVLSSEYAVSPVTAQISAKIIEASEDYKALIGTVAGAGSVYFAPTGATLDPNAVTFLDAESNQADRVVLYFDKAVDVATFVKSNPATGNFVTKASGTPGVLAQVTKDNVSIVVSQTINGVVSPKEVLGFKAVAGNNKAIEVILAKNTVLTDNQTVTIDAQIGTTKNNKTFTLTDARQPEVTSVTPQGLRTLNLKFSESVVDASIIIDGQLEADFNDIKVTFGEYDAAKGIDYRDTAKVELLKYEANRPGTITTPGATYNLGSQRYFAPGSHSVTVHQLRDFAGLSDFANVSTSQLLTFNVVADTAAPTAKVTVESPEQFRITFDKEIDRSTQDIANILNGNAVAGFPNVDRGFQIYDKANAKYVPVTQSAPFAVLPQFVVTQPDADKSEFVVELTSDWTQLLAGDKDTYANYSFQFAFPDKFFKNASNGVTAGKIELSLNYSGSALNSVDNSSPVISDIVETNDANVYVVKMNEPVKLPKASNPNENYDNAGATLASSQGATLPAVQVEFQGKDKDGNIVVVQGVVGNAQGEAYASTNGDDKEFYVTVDTSKTGGKNLVALVTDGYSADWTVVVKSISDDVGNTAATVTKNFKVGVQQVATSFYILSKENTGVTSEKVIAYDRKRVNDQDTTSDVIKISFSKAIVHTGGVNDLTNPANWQLNGKALVNVRSITVSDEDGVAGNETVIITFKDDKALSESLNNVITVNRNVLSQDGSKLVGEFEVVAQTIKQY